MLPRTVGPVGKFVRQMTLARLGKFLAPAQWAQALLSKAPGDRRPAGNQYFGTLGSISFDQAVMPPLTLLRFLKPCWRRNSTAFIERPPILQCR